MLAADIFSSPKHISLEAVVILPPGLPVIPASWPKNKLLLPVVADIPADDPTAVLSSPVVFAFNA